MSAARTSIMVGIAGVLLVGGVWWTYTTQFADPIRAARSEIESAQQALDAGAVHTRRRKETRRSLRELATNTLGRTTESVRDRLLAQLNGVATEAGLGAVRVSAAARARGQTNKGAKDSRSTFRSRDVRDRIDFYVLEGDLVGEGTYQQVVRALGLIESQPWLKRVRAVTLDPKDQGRRVEVRVKVEAAFVPEFSPAHAPSIAGMDEERLALLTALVEKDGMTAPPPPAPPPPAPSPSPVQVASTNPKAGPRAKPKPPKPPYHQWRVTGWVTDATGVEVWTRNAKNGNRKTLRPGSRLLGAVFHGVGGWDGDL